jgi:predicted metal-dependent phosphoesterase TrpH
MKHLIDLQIQTVYSDGECTPSAIVRLAKHYGFGTIAITDHDTVAGVPEALRAGRRFGVTVIPGIELYSRLRGKELHILGYNIDIHNRPLRRFLADIQKKHRAWCRTVCRKLAALGYRVDGALVLRRSSSDLIGFGELLRILESTRLNRQILRKTFGSARPDLFEVIQKYFVRGAQAFAPLPEKRVTTQRAIAVIRNAGGIPVLAHPGQHLSFSEDAMVADLVRMGIRGIEALSPHHTWHQMLHYQRLAKKLRIFVTAGSDFHERLTSRYTTRVRWDVFRPITNTLPWKGKR